MRRHFPDKPPAILQGILGRLDWCYDALSGKDELYEGLAALDSMARDVHALSLSIHHAASRASQRSGKSLEEVLMPVGDTDGGAEGIVDRADEEGGSGSPDEGKAGRTAARRSKSHDSEEDVEAE